MKILLTGGAGFIGSNLVRYLIEETKHSVINLDKLTYAGNPCSLADIENHERYQFEQIDLCDAAAVQDAFQLHQPGAVMHLAAESHVDRSIDGPGDFIQTNIVGTFNLLQASLQYWKSLQRSDAGALGSHISYRVSQESFRFLHVSTDEVYGSLDSGAAGFSETTPYDPHSPYSASKASSDHLARAWADTYGLPVLITNCSNNYGPYQFPEKLIPVVILKCLRGEPIPVYGKGENIRDWLYVEDHCRALYSVLEKGTPGQTYNIGGNNERENIELVRMLCRLMDEFRGPRSEIGSRKSEVGGRESEDGDRKSGGRSQNDDTTNLSPNKDLKSADLRPLPSDLRHESLITFVTDRPGHDMRYAIDATKIKNELGWEPKEDFESGFRKTVQWYLENRDWWEAILSGDYQLERLGTSEAR